MQQGVDVIGLVGAVKSTGPDMHDPDLIILDAQMPDIHGFDVCRMLRDDPRISATTPIVITTSGPSGRAQRLEAYRAGAWEFLGQPLDGEALLLKLRTFVQSKLEVDALRDESLVDPATGFYNMRGLARRAREIGSEASRRHQALACVVFAPIVDSTEDPADEAVLEEVAEQVGRVFREAGRSSDAVGRLVHGEFAVIDASIASWNDGTASCSYIKLISEGREEHEVEMHPHGVLFRSPSLALALEGAIARTMGSERRLRRAEPSMNRWRG